MKTQPNLYVGQLVLLIDEIVPRDQWRLGRIKEVRGDGIRTRSAVVETANGRTYERHISKLVMLEME